MKVIERKHKGEYNRDTSQEQVSTWICRRIFEDYFLLGQRKMDSLKLVDYIRKTPSLIHYTLFLTVITRKRYIFRVFPDS